jgi:hypothetical protein
MSPSRCSPLSQTRLPTSSTPPEISPRNLAELLADLAQRVADDVEAATLAIAGLQLPGELGTADVATTAAAVIIELPAIRDSLADAIAARKDRARAGAKSTALGRDQANTEQERTRLLELEDQVRSTGPATVTICSPQPQVGSAADVRAYGSTARVNITISSAAVTAHGTLAAPREVFLAVNGVPATIPRTAWAYDGQRARLTVAYNLTAVNSALRTGLNSIECSFVDGFHPPARAVVLFLVYPETGTDGIEVDMVDGRLGVRPGLIPLNLTGWRMVDGVGRTTSLDGLVLPGTRHTLPDLVPDPNRPGRPLPPAGAPCGPRVTLVDPRGRRRGEVRQTTT